MESKKNRTHRTHRNKTDWWSSKAEWGVREDDLKEGGQKTQTSKYKDK